MLPPPMLRPPVPTPHPKNNQPAVFLTFFNTMPRKNNESVALVFWFHMFAVALAMFPPPSMPCSEKQSTCGAIRRNIQKKGIDLRHWWFGWAFPEGLAMLPPPTPQPLRKTISLLLRRCIPSKINLWRWWVWFRVALMPPPSPKKSTCGIAGLLRCHVQKNHLQHWWLGSALPAALAMLPPPMLHRPQKTINLRRFWSLSMPSRKNNHLRFDSLFAAAKAMFPSLILRP